MSQHIEQVSIDMKFENHQTLPAEPKGRGKIERFFETVNEMFLAYQPGYALRGAGQVAPVLTLEELDERFRKWLIDEYMHKEHSELGTSPKLKSQAVVPRMPDSADKLDLLLLTVAKPRTVHRDGNPLSRLSLLRY